MEKVGIIGYGNMGRAIAECIFKKYEVCVFDKDKNKISGLSEISAAPSITQLVQQSQIIILAVKPQDFEALLKEIKPYSSGKLVISIAAGISSGYISSQLGPGARIVRIMPNMPAQIGRGISVISKGQNATDGDLNLAWQLAFDIFSNLGSVLPVDKEEMINAATAISGSGPGLFCFFVKDAADAAAKRDELVKKLAESAVNLGFDQREAELLAVGTIDGTIAMLNERKLTPEQVIKMVASKGGTTEAGLEVLRAGGTLKEATEKAARRAAELEKRS